MLLLSIAVTSGRLLSRTIAICDEPVPKIGCDDIRPWKLHLSIPKVSNDCLKEDVRRERTPSAASHFRNLHLLRLLDPIFSMCVYIIYHVSEVSLLFTPKIAILASNSISYHQIAIARLGRGSTPSIMHECVSAGRCLFAGCNQEL